MMMMIYLGFSSLSTDSALMRSMLARLGAGLNCFAMDKL
jgi:hypothetical protein